MDKGAWRGVDMMGGYRGRDVGAGNCDVGMYQ